MSAIWLKVKEYAKTIAAFVAGVVGSVIVNLVNGSTPWPSNQSEWIQLAIASFGPALATWLTTNKITQAQLDKDPNVIGGVVVTNAVVPAPVLPPSAGGYRDPYA
jgi:hypothetical protein